MSRFYGNMVSVGCGNGCNSKLQKLLFDENGVPIDTDWQTLQEVYNQHNASCSVENLYTNDPNAFYGNPDECTGFVIEGDSNSGYRYCEY